MKIPDWSLRICIAFTIQIATFCLKTLALISLLELIKPKLLNFTLLSYKNLFL